MSYRIFNRPDRFAEGWYWALDAAALARGGVAKLNLLGRDLALYRGEDGKVAALDAFCPHMGAHLGEGNVDGCRLRCLFHDWAYEPDGRCSDAPGAAGGVPPSSARTSSWPVTEAYGLIWVWTGPEARRPAPFVPELGDEDADWSHGSSFVKDCHPNVVMINAIDAHHFNTVHHLPVKLEMEPRTRNENNIEFANTTTVPTTSLLGRLIAPFYHDALTYWMSYWYGSTGTVTLGPDFLHFHILFALRAAEGGKTEGRTVLVTRKRAGLHGWALNRVLLALTNLVGSYFAHGDTKIFRSIKFDLKTPLAADRPILRFIEHLEKQAVSPWCRPVEPAREPAEA
ncbi:MAG: aromatic ring-hydroxylating dioxygenase subunit alpha [Elusimicrobia bacterium]|nr:aromatic ring-hydroxylating dioxygenase subunit alpha [Elusimicrobiota bacterium]